MVLSGAADRVRFPPSSGVGVFMCVFLCVGVLNVCVGYEDMSVLDII